MLVSDHWIEQDIRDASMANLTAGMTEMIFVCENHDAGEQLAISSHGSVLQLVSISKQIHNASSQLGLQSQQLLSLGSCRCAASGTCQRPNLSVLALMERCALILIPDNLYLHFGHTQGR